MKKKDPVQPSTTKHISIGYIHIESWPEEKQLHPDWMIRDEEYQEEVSAEKPEEVILKYGQYQVMIDYPLANSYKETLLVPEEGMTRIELADILCMMYHRIYQEEELTSNIPEGMVPGMLNRSRTNGKYGIWGHCLGDLILNSIDINDGLITLGIDS